jgi:hypothetical protein
MSPVGPTPETLRHDADVVPFVSLLEEAAECRRPCSTRGPDVSLRGIRVYLETCAAEPIWSANSFAQLDRVTVLCDKPTRITKLSDAEEFPTAAGLKVVSS